MQALQILKAQILEHERAEHMRDMAGRRRFNARLRQLRAGGGWDCVNPITDASAPQPTLVRFDMRNLPAPLLSRSSFEKKYEFSQGAGYTMWIQTQPGHNPNHKIGIMLAGNSGRPAGAIGRPTGIMRNWNIYERTFTRTGALGLSVVKTSAGIQVESVSGQARSLGVKVGAALAALSVAL